MFKQGILFKPLKVKQVEMDVPLFNVHRLTSHPDAFGFEGLSRSLAEEGLKHSAFSALGRTTDRRDGDVALSLTEQDSGFRYELHLHFS